MRPPGRRIAIVTACLAAGMLAVAGWLLRRELVLWYHFAPLGKNAQGFPEYRHRQTGIVFVRLPGGKFWMGAQAKDPNGRNYDPEAEDGEGPVHEVTLSPFMIGKFEVTQGQWKAVMGSNPAEFKGGDDQPVENVSLEDAREFMKRTRLSLPTEAQWECACRAGTTAPVAGTGKLDDMGWYSENSGNASGLFDMYGNDGKRTHPIGGKGPNGFGIFDMHGNVQEWCENAFDVVFYGNPEAKELDPIPFAGSEIRVIRGGHWSQAAKKCRSSSRDWSRPDHRNGFMGFRSAWRL